jgi:two-component system LytT family response regulator
MINAIIIDDEMHCRKILAMMLKEYCPSVKLLEQCSDGEAGLRAIENLKPNLVFLDVEMPKLNGFAMLEQISEVDFAVIFTTGYDQYAIKAFRYCALDYLLKPIDPKELISAVNKVQHRLQLPGNEQFDLLLKKIGNKDEILQKIPIPTTDGYELLAVADVLYCEANDNYTRFSLRNKKKMIACRMLKDVEEQLTDFPFFVRIHNSYIVNMKEVKKYVRGEGGYLIMSDDSSVSVSRSRKDLLLKWFK